MLNLQVTSKKTRMTPAVVNLVEETEVEDDSSRLHSEEFPAEMRPQMFKDDRIFNKLPFEKAASIVWEYQQGLDKKKEKQRKRGEQEKSDDKLLTIRIPAGEDDGQNQISEARKLTSRPVNKEIKDQMSWLPVRYKEIIRNLPLRVYGLEDSVSTSAIEACHDLTSKIEIKQFSPTNLRNSGKSIKQTATCEQGKLVLENSDIYGELETTTDVVLAFNTLASIWQKLHPHWPAANIGLRVCFSMKLFAHCEDEARTIMIEWANRFLQANASRAANGEGAMSYERAYNLAGSVCKDNRFSKEAPATKGKGVATVEVELGRSVARGRGGSSVVRGARGGRGGGGGSGGGRGGVANAAGSTAMSYGVLLPSGEGICKFWQDGRCNTGATSSSCNRNGVTFKHVCDFRKGAGNYCQKNHRRTEHDPTKH
jgi:hypothetical protein